MSDDVLEDMAAPCDRCRVPGPAAWNPLWRVRLCFTCRAAATDAELRPVRDREEWELLAKAGVPVGTVISGAASPSAADTTAGDAPPVVPGMRAFHQIHAFRAPRHG